MEWLFKCKLDPNTGHVTFHWQRTERQTIYLGCGTV